MVILRNNRHEAFCLEYMKDRNATAAYKRAGYRPKNNQAAAAGASRLLTNVKAGVPRRIADLEAEFAKRIGFEVEDIFNKYLAIILADPSALSKIVCGACRFCHGNHYQYQWRTVREFDEATRRWLAMSACAEVSLLKPEHTGGFGYRSTREPHPNCPECDGLGLARPHFAATESIPAMSRVLFAGAEQTTQGPKIHVHDQMAALEKLARHLGFFSSCRLSKAG